MAGTRSAIWRNVDAGDRRAIIHEAVPRLAEVARGSGIAGAATTRAQREAKDALFVLRTDAAPDDRAAADAALDRVDDGRSQRAACRRAAHSSEQILLADRAARRRRGSPS